MYKKLTIDSDQNSIRIVEKTIDEVTGELKISQDCYGKILVSTIEGVNNAIIHGNKSDSGKKVSVEFRCSENEFIVKIKDDGDGFNPERIPDPTLPENIEQLNGRGIFLMKRLADSIKYSKKGNTVTMTFKIDRD
ncbi:MAG TPA: ATP-binding protein [Bacteroidales bacterium]|nr:ATP-binding protein [Bacteroidales bacterium]